MSKWDKLINRILEIDDDIRFEEIQKVLEFYGYVMNEPKSGGSHYTFKRNSYRITIPKHKPIKRVYLKKIRNIIMEEINHEQKH